MTIIQENQAMILQSLFFTALYLGGASGQSSWLKKPQAVSATKDFIYTTDSTGRTQCDLEMPFYVLVSSEGHAHCATECANRWPCVVYNYFWNSTKCQLFEYMPISLSYDNNCINYFWISQLYDNCWITIRSYGLYDSTPWLGYINVNNQRVYVSGVNATRGVNTIILDPRTCSATSSNHFDTFANTAQSAALAAYLTSLQSGTVVLGVSFDEPTQYLGPAVATIEAAGVNISPIVNQYRSKFAFVLEIGAPKKTVFATMMPGGTYLQLNSLVRVGLNSSSLLIIQV